MPFFALEFSSFSSFSSTDVYVPIFFESKKGKKKGRKRERKTKEPFFPLEEKQEHRRHHRRCHLFSWEKGEGVKFSQ